MSAKIYLGIALITLMLLGMLPLGSTPLNIPTVRAADYNQAFPSYYRGPHLQELYIKTFDNPDAEFLALQGGSPEGMDWFLTPTQISTIAGNQKIQLNSSNDLGTVEVVFNNGRFPTNVTAYRQAISLLINKQDIVNTKLPGVGGVMDDQLTPGYPAPWRNTSYPWTQDVALARTTLVSGGFSYGYWCGANPCGPGDTVSTYSCPVDPIGSTHLVLKCWKYTPAGHTHNWILNWTNTIFYARQDDAVRDYIGTQIGLTVGANKNTQPGIDRLFSVIHISSFESSRLAYSAPDCPADSQGNKGYESNACVGSHPAFSMYTQGLIGGTPDPGGIWFFYFNPQFLDISGLNFGHWNNATMQTYFNRYFYSVDQACTMTPCEGAVYAYERALNGLFTAAAYWDPMYYQKDFNPSTERVTGMSSGQNSAIPNGAFYETNFWSHWREHLRGRLFGGSLTVGDYTPIHDVNIFNVADGNWVYNFMLMNRIYDSMLQYDPNLGSTANPFVPDLAINMTVATLTNPRLPVGYGPGYYHPTSTAPYWSAYSGPYATLSGQGQKIVFNVYPNAKWHNGDPITDNDLLWNVITDAMDPAGNTQGAAFPSLAYANITAAHQLTLWFNLTSYDWTLFAAGVLFAPPTPWINLYTAQKGAWASGTGILSDLSVNSRTDLNLTLGGSTPNPQNTWEGSSAYTFDVAYCIANPSTCFSAANAAGDVFGFKANDNWWLSDSNKLSYTTGIALMSPYLPESVAPGTASVHLKVAVVNGQNAKGLHWDGGLHDWVPDPTIVSDTAGATVLACIVETGCATTPLTGGSPFYEGDLSLPAPSVTTTYHVRITAAKGGSLTTTYDDGSGAGCSQVSPTAGSSGLKCANEGDPYHTAITVQAITPTSTPISPMQLLLGLLTMLLVIPVARKVKRIQL